MSGCKLNRHRAKTDGRVHVKSKRLLVISRAVFTLTAITGMLLSGCAGTPQGGGTEATTTGTLTRAPKESVLMEGVSPSSRLIASPDLRRVARIAREGNKEFVVIDGKEGKRYDNIFDVVFSPDGKRLAYMARLGERDSVVFDGQEGKQYDGGAQSNSPRAGQ